MPDIGEFTVVDAALNAVEEEQDKRPEAAIEADKSKRAPITTDAQRWKSDMNDLDFPGVDTPTSSPNVLPKDLMQSEQPRTTAQFRQESPVDPIGQEERRREEQEAQLAASDAGVTRGEAFEGVGATSMVVDERRNEVVQDEFATYSATPEEDEERLSELL